MTRAVLKCQNRLLIRFWNSKDASERACANKRPAALNADRGIRLRVAVLIVRVMYIPPSVIQRALKDYFDRSGRLKEMHGFGSVGKVLSAGVDSTGVYISAVVEDPAAQQRVQKKILQAFSVGGEIGIALRDRSIVDERCACRPPI